VTLPVFLVLDGLWLGLMARDFYRNTIGDLLRDDPRWGAAAAFYLLYLAGLIVFAIWPGIERGSAVRAALLGGLFGLICYATYDLTNLATLKGFPTVVAVVDLAWGFAVSSATAWAGWQLARLVGAR